MDILSFLARSFPFLFITLYYNTNLECIYHHALTSTNITNKDFKVEDMDNHTLAFSVLYFIYIYIKLKKADWLYVSKQPSSWLLVWGVIQGPWGGLPGTKWAAVPRFSPLFFLSFCKGSFSLPHSILYLYLWLLLPSYTLLSLAHPPVTPSFTSVVQQKLVYVFDVTNLTIQPVSYYECLRLA